MPIEQHSTAAQESEDDESTNDSNTPAGSSEVRSAWSHLTSHLHIDNVSAHTTSWFCDCRHGQSSAGGPGDSAPATEVGTVLGGSVSKAE
jgi:hypothetical protein